MKSSRRMKDVCPECGMDFEKTKRNQKRCELCIEARPCHGYHANVAALDRYAKAARQRIWSQVKHWHIGMGQAKLYAMFPDLRP